MINTYDIDGVIFMGDLDGVYPGTNDVIITGMRNSERRHTEEQARKQERGNSDRFSVRVVLMLLFFVLTQGYESVHFKLQSIISLFHLLIM